MSKYDDIIRAHLRITILRILLESPSYTSNDSMITDLTKIYAITPSRDKTRTELAWLKEQGLVETDGEGKLIIATLTMRGEEAANGCITVPGVKRPSAGS